MTEAHTAEDILAGRCDEDELNLDSPIWGDRSGEVSWEQVQIIASYLPRNTNITLLAYVQSTIGGTAVLWVVLTLFFLVFPSTNCFSLNGNFIGARGARLIAEALKSNTTLRTLW